MAFLPLMITAMALGDVKESIYKAYINDDMGAWKSVIDSMQETGNRDGETMLSLVNYHYGYIGWCLGKKKEQEALGYLNLARDNLDILERKGACMSMVNAYRSAFYGFEISMKVIKAPVLGPKSMKCAGEALTLDPENAFALVQAGNIKYYMPALFGGSVGEAIVLFLKAREIMERKRDNLHHDWNYLHLLSIIARAYSDTGNLDAAKSVCEFILKTEPGFRWIRDDVYPGVLEKIKK